MEGKEDLKHMALCKYREPRRQRGGERKPGVREPRISKEENLVTEGSTLRTNEIKSKHYRLTPDSQ